MRQNITNKFHLRSIAGLTLIEVLVTVVITSIGLMGLVSLQFQAIKATTDSGNRSQAVWVFNDIINRIHANEVASNSYVTVGNVSCAAAPGTICSSHHTGTALVNAATCTGPQLALWDLYEVACPLRNAPFIGDSSRYLPDAQLSITCSGACGDGNPLLITLTWRAKSDNESITGAARTANSGLLTLTDTITP